MKETYASISRFMVFSCGSDKVLLCFHMEENTNIQMSLTQQASGQLEIALTEAVVLHMQEKKINMIFSPWQWILTVSCMIQSRRKTEWNRPYKVISFNSLLKGRVQGTLIPAELPCHKIGNSAPSNGLFLFLQTSPLM